MKRYSFYQRREDKILQEQPLSAVHLPPCQAEYEQMFCSCSISALTYLHSKDNLFTSH